MSNKKIRLVIGVEGTDAIARVVPHATDLDKVMLKSTHPTSILRLCGLMGIEAGEIVEGANFWMMSIPESLLGPGLYKLAVGAMAAARDCKAQLAETAGDTEGGVAGLLTEAAEKALN